MKKLISSILIASAIFTSNIALSSQNQEVSLQSLGHSDGTDKDGNWIAVYMYKISVEEGDAQAIGYFSITSNSSDIESKKIEWKENPADIDVEDQLGMYPDIILKLKRD